ncbi:hypothetical protein D3C86_1082620 [compost metagenome]
MARRRRSPHSRTGPADRSGTGAPPGRSWPPPGLEGPRRRPGPVGARGHTRAPPDRARRRHRPGHRPHPLPRPRFPPACRRPRRHAWPIAPREVQEWRAAASVRAPGPIRRPWTPPHGCPRRQRCTGARVRALPRLPHRPGRRPAGRAWRARPRVAQRSARDRSLPECCPADSCHRAAHRIRWRAACPWPPADARLRSRKNWRACCAGCRSGRPATVRGSPDRRR